MLDLAKPIYPLFFSLLKSNPEGAHLQLIKTLTSLEKSLNTPWGRTIKQQLENSFCYRDPRLVQTKWGLTFPNPVGLAPGFDKDGVAATMWQCFGFGFAELGAVTLHSQPGNPRPRMFRLPLDQAALNRMGANNLGAEVMSHTLKESYARQPLSIPIGINLCKSKITPLEEAPSDYLASFRYLQDLADYFVVNVSSPNTPGLRDLQAGKELKGILAALHAENQGNKPLFVKISPDLDTKAIATILEIALDYQLAGVIATNTTISRSGLKTKILPATGNPIETEAGGISGAPIRQRSTEIIRFIWRETQGKLPIIGVGGIFTALDALEKITAGASLLQVYTGWIYSGPWMIPELLKDLVKLLEDQGFSHLSQAVGSAN
jgi:dihydroorotate dehydrogenase